SAQLIALAAKQRRAAATYLESARSIALQGDVVTIEFEASNRFAAEYLSEQAQFLSSTAEQIARRPLRVSIRTRDDAPKAAAPAAPPTQDDPVLRSFQKHLGGEVVSRGSRRTPQEE
ncbi:MAG TPA: hypothetical protein VFV54_11745, partial [Thermoanaerobaculia bacterium]|nr:hypothetical protein [Thermoanaerobaculia bacterium]